MQFANMPTIGVIEPHDNIKRIEAVVDIKAEPSVEMPKTTEDAFNLIEKDQAILKFRLHRKDTGEDESGYIEFYTEVIDLPKMETNFFSSEAFTKRYNSKKNKVAKRAKQLIQHAHNVMAYLKHKEKVENQGADSEASENVRIPGMQSMEQTSAGAEDKTEELYRQYAKAEEKINEFVVTKLGGYRAQDIGMVEFLNGLYKRFDRDEVDQVFMQIEDTFNKVVSRLSGEN